MIGAPSIRSSRTIRRRARLPVGPGTGCSNSGPPPPATRSGGSTQRSATCGPGCSRWEFVDRSIALAAKAFVSFFPFLIVVTALTPDSVRDEVLIDVSGRFGISGSGYGTLQQAFTSADETRAATGDIGALVAVAFAISFTTALQRVYLRAWRRGMTQNASPRDQRRQARKVASNGAGSSTLVMTKGGGSCAPRLRWMTPCSPRRSD